MKNSQHSRIYFLLFACFKIIVLVDLCQEVLNGYKGKYEFLILVLRRSKCRSSSVCIFPCN